MLKLARRKATPDPTRGIPRLTADRRALAARYVSLALSLASDYDDAHPRLADDIASAALFGVVEAAARFRPETGVYFGHWARQTIHFRILDAIRVRRPSMSTADLVARLGAEGRRNLALFGLADGADAAPGREVEEGEFFAGATAGLEELDPDGPELVELVYRRGYTLAGAAAKLDRRRADVRDLHLNCLAAMARRLPRPDGAADPTPDPDPEHCDRCLSSAEGPASSSK